MKIEIKSLKDKWNVLVDTGKGAENYPRLEVSELFKLLIEKIFMRQ